MNKPQQEYMYAVYNRAAYQANEDGGVKPNAIYRWKDQAESFVKLMNERFGCQFEIVKELWSKV